VTSIDAETVDHAFVAELVDLEDRATRSTLSIGAGHAMESTEERSNAHDGILRAGTSLRSCR
jgi:hypothetical protein